MDLNRIVSILKILANPHRASIVRVLHEKGRCSFAQIKQEIGGRKQISNSKRDTKLVWNRRRKNTRDGTEESHTRCGSGKTA